MQDLESSFKTVHLWPEEIAILSFPIFPHLLLKAFCEAPVHCVKHVWPTDIHSKPFPEAEIRRIMLLVEN